MAQAMDVDANVVANDDDLDRILSHSNAIIGNLDKLEGEASIQCNGTSTIDLTDIDGRSSTTGVGVNNGRITPGVSNATVVRHYPVGTLTTCAACATAVRTDSGPVNVRAGTYAGQIMPQQGAVQAARALMQPSRLMPPPLCGPSAAVINGRPPDTAAHPSGLVTMLMRPSSGPGTVASQLRAGVGRSQGGPAVPTSSVQLVNVGSVTRSEQGTPRLVAITSGVMPAGVRFIQSSPRQPQQQPRLHHQVIAFDILLLSCKFCNITSHHITLRRQMQASTASVSEKLFIIRIYNT